MESYFIALEPEKRLIDLINNQKQIVRDNIGKQKYLHHPPHFTLFIFNMENPEELFNILEKFTEDTTKFSIKINDFKVFYNDIQTDGHTITYSLEESDIIVIRKIQLKIADYILEKIKKFYSINNEIYNQSSDIEKSNIEKYGYLFIGENFIPHITISSIDKDKFEQIFEELKKTKIQGEFSIESINLYKVGEPSILIKKFELKNA